MKTEKIAIFDTTLRDGQQCPGAGMSHAENLAYADLAAACGVDVLEAGFPAASAHDFAINHAIAKHFSQTTHGPTVAALCQARENQVDITINALSPLIESARARLHIYLPVAPELMRASLGENYNKNKLISQLQQLITKASASGLEVEYSPEGYSQMAENFDFVTDTLRAAISAGATIINCPDTIGGACRRQGEDYFVEKIKQHAAIMANEFPDKAITWSVHCHNDFGLAVENSMNAVFDGPVRQIEGCFNGIGERAGNAALEQCIMYVKHFGFDKTNNTQWVTGVNTAYLQRISDFVAEHMLPRQPHSPINGDNAARHTSGGHTNAILNNPLAYQPFDPADVGNRISFVFGPLSGGNHAKAIIEQAGYRCDDDEKQAVGQYIKDYYHTRRKGITDAELIEAYLDYRKPIKVKTFNYQRENKQCRLALQGKFFTHPSGIDIHTEGGNSALGTLADAIQVFLPGIVIVNYHSEATSQGIGAMSRSNILLQYQSEQYQGIDEDQDIEISALKALIDAANNAYIATHFLTAGQCQKDANHE